MASAMAGIAALRDTYFDITGRMEKAVEGFRGQLTSVRTGRANVHMLDPVRVDAYGSMMTLSQVATVNASDGQLITVQPYDPSLIKEIERSIIAADIGLNPQNDGKIIRLPIPPMNEERRKETVKHLNKVLEDHRTAIRNIRRDGNDAIKKAVKDKLVSADEEKRASDEVQQLTDTEIKRIEEMFKVKEKEVMTV
jgi:ribosome recycling factor